MSNGRLGDVTAEQVSAGAVLHEVVKRIGGLPRAGQIQMVEEVTEALSNDDHLMVQAGTGTGKSFGYLVPALLNAVQRQQKSIISTATLALQRQIIRHDAPLVSDVVYELTGTRPQVALLKGWNNYVCLRKANGGYPEEGTLLSRAEGEFGASATGEEVVRAREWSMVTDTGDRDDLVPGVSDKVWSQVSVPKRECIGDTCPLRGSCFAQLARQEAEDADVVVTNHAMLGVQANQTPVLPPKDAYIIDEAHDLVERVTSQLTSSLSRYDVTSVARMMRHSGLDDSDLDLSADELNEALKMIPEGRILEFDEDFTDAIARLLGRIQAAGENVAGLSSKDEAQATAKQILRSRLQELSEFAHNVLGDAIENEQLVAWKTQSLDGYQSCHLAPLDVSVSIAHHLFEENPVVLTSATLKLGDSFDAMANRVGFSLGGKESWRGVDVGSPFSPHTQGVLYVASDLPIPGKQGYGEEHLNEIRLLIEASGGGALGLFTSKSAAVRAAEFMRENSRMRVLCQGEDQLSTLVEEFAQDDAASLFGTLSLWQGVDIPGHTNRLVIIDRIPFPRPDEPLAQARSQSISKHGGNGFMSVAATNAALLLAQGAGRLLRRIDDRGVVAVLDPRLRNARYAGFLLNSMPGMWRTTDRAVVTGVLQRNAQCQAGESK
ncbi:ATP-dependent DNA helicase [Arcanobacterium ihumii]|uniref:ATP-dependent DNA helicase n=1 Tax=Arcanobacterium ihumii TaxID=2138162 RepID=UPI000F533560|nr:ATP-dependent DNA helicase [Arcanobacterium ihumii]